MEPGRPEADFGVYFTYGTGSRFPMNGHVLQDVYDIAVNSMDFGSGFLSTEEVANLRILGRFIDAEPLHYKCGIRVYPNRPDLSRPCDCGALEI